MKTKSAKRASEANSVETSPKRKIKSDQKITPFLWFDGQAEEAASFYTAIFDNSKIVDVARYGEVGPGEKGSVMTVSFELEGQKFVGLNGVRITNLLRPFLFISVAKRRKRWITFGSDCRRVAESRVNAGGLRTSLAFRGKSFLMR